MFQSGQNTVLIHCPGHKVGVRAYESVGVAHGYSHMGVAEHRNVVFPIAEGHGVLQGDAEEVQNGVHTLVLAAAWGNNIHEIWVPAHDLQSWEGVS